MKLADKISQKLRTWSKGSGDMTLPNFYISGYECDMFRLRKSGLTDEYEIKISRSDFLNDFKKHWGGSKKHDSIKQGRRTNRFWFVVPEGLIEPKEVPDYCGLVYWKEWKTDWGLQWTMNIVKNAKLIHKEKLIIRDLTMACYYREINARIKLAEYVRNNSSERHKALSKRNDQLEELSQAYTRRNMVLDCIKEGDLRWAKTYANNEGVKKYFPEVLELIPKAPDI